MVVGVVFPTKQTDHVTKDSGTAPVGLATRQSCRAARGVLVARSVYTRQVDVGRTVEANATDCSCRLKRRGCCRVARGGAGGCRITAQSSGDGARSEVTRGISGNDGRGGVGRCGVGGQRDCGGAVVAGAGQEGAKRQCGQIAAQGHARDRASAPCERRAIPVQDLVGSCWGGDEI